MEKEGQALDQNKTELFRFLSREIFKLSEGEISSAFDATIASKREYMALSPTDHEEADTRLEQTGTDMGDMGRKSLSRVMIRTVDTDVFLLSISLYDDVDLEQLWIDFGSGKQRCFLPMHEMVLDPLK